MRKLMMAAAGVLWISAAMGMAVTAEETELALTETAGEVLEWTEEMQQAFVDEGYEGQIYTVDGLGLQLLIPDGLEQREPTEEEKAKDDILVFESEDQTKKIEFVLGPLGECETLDDVKALMEENYPGLTITPTKINEFDTLVYGTEASDSMAVLIGAGESGFLRIICHPVTDPDMYRQYSFVAASIMRIPETEETTE